MIKACLVCSVKYIRIQEEDNNTPREESWDGLSLHPLHQKWNIDLIAFYSSKWIMSNQWIRHLPAFSSTNNSFLFMAIVIGSYDQLIFVICGLICTYFPVVTLYYWCQHVAISSQMAMHFIQLLVHTKPSYLQSSWLGQSLRLLQDDLRAR